MSNIFEIRHSEKGSVNPKARCRYLDSLSDGDLELLHIYTKIQLVCFDLNKTRDTSLSNPSQIHI